ncbi:synaptogenesis protein syg-2 isoform X4 [Cryptotermes secundus]|uniref:synaptogenesis protein syg-2 isoform X4 n=1 Tax=Cryptotermes secundus TaxID=105785 RepID=UPI000CD7C246|nr:synaptogenesis protein syg-2 isoform X4 [Cryptotermes secundus]
MEGIGRFPSAFLWVLASHVPLFHVTAVAGDAVYLPCDITTDSGDAVLLVLWYREDLGTPIYSVDAREQEFGKAERWSDENVFANRALFMMEKKPAELGVDNIRKEDAGIYRCRVDFKMAQTRNSRVNLTVIVPPEKLVIVDEEGTERTSVVGPYSEGADLALRCDVYGGKPRPVVKWYRNDQLASNVSTAVKTSVGGHLVRSEIIVRNLGRQDLHSQLKCRASNNNRTHPLEATVHVDMNFMPLDVRILGASQPLSEGRRYDLLCQSSGSRPPASITWKLDGRRLEGTKETTSNDGNTTTSTLSLTPKKEDAGKYLSCQAMNTIFQKEGLEDGWKLEIYYIPMARLQLGSSLNPETIREGTDVYFDCLIQARPSVYKVEWRHNGRMLNHNVGQGIIISNQSLVLQGVSRASAGNYTCVGHNTEGDGESNYFYLNVMYAPTCKANQTRVHGVAKQEKANISCQVEANPPDVQFRWTFNNSAESLDVASAHIARSGTSSVVSYTPMTELDYGTLLCWASNRIGNQRVPCVFHIIAAGRPDQVYNCTVSNTSMTSFSVHCSPGFNGGMEQLFLMEVRESQSQVLHYNVSSTVPRFSVTGLEAGSHYQACVYSFNHKGRSEPVVIQASTLRLPEKQLTSEKERPRPGFRFTPMMSVLIGVVSALLIVAVVVGIVLRLQCSHNEDRRKQHKAAAHEQRNRGSSSGGGGSGGEKGGNSPINKLDPGGTESGDSDEKNPDIIPQPSNVEPEAHADYVRKRQHISTIETTSPSRSLLQGAPGGTAAYAGYCTLRNGMPLQDLNNIGSKPKMKPGGQGSSYQSSGCTLPRQHWPTYTSGIRHHQQVPGSSMCTTSYPSPGAVASLHHHSHPHLHHQASLSQLPPEATASSTTAVVKSQKQPLLLAGPALGEEELPTAETPLMVTKRESTV